MSTSRWALRLKAIAFRRAMLKLPKPSLWSWTVIKVKGNKFYKKEPAKILILTGSFLADRKV
jgi:hypothetical protein